MAGGCARLFPTDRGFCEIAHQSRPRQLPRISGTLKMNSVCIVTNEVYPIDKGGIARLMYNFAINNSQSETPADIHFLLPAKWRMHAAEVEAELVGLAKLHYCR